MNTVYITNKDNPFIVSLLKEFFDKISVFNSFADFSTQEEVFDSVIISSNFEKTKIEDFVKKTIRTSDKLFIVPIFLEDNGTFLSHENVVNLENIKEHIISVKNLYKEIEHHNYSSWENRILSYFYTRPDLSVCPKIDKNHDMFYYYPHVEQFYDGQEDYFYWMEEMATQKIFSKVKLVDRLFCCPYCFSALMKFSDHCPNCGSINIKQERFVHCFSCGYVSPESKFMKDERFVCPSCKSKLKLIGEDYDRPLENGVCMDCGNYHIDSTLQISCLSCSKIFTTEELSKKSVFEYKLTEYGRNQIKFDTVSSTNIIASELNYIALNYFIFTLNWSIQMQKRYIDSYFSLVALKIIMETEFSVYDLLVEFSKLLRSSFRTTDFCSKIDNNTFIFLFPKTGATGLNAIKTKIDTFLGSIKLSKGQFNIKTEYFSSTQENIAEENSQQILSNLTNKL